MLTLRRGRVLNDFDMPGSCSRGAASPIDSGMTCTPPLSNAIARLWQPRLSLTGCVRGVMVRDTTGVLLAPEQRFNHYAATPLCSISWWFSGSVEMLEPGEPAALSSRRRSVPAAVAFAGPHTRPTVSWSAGPGHGMMLLLLPDALQSMTGVEPRQWMNRLVDAADVLPAPWLVICSAVSAAESDEARVALIETFLDPLWQAARPHHPLGVHRYLDWAQGLALRAATSRSGRSLRQIERRIRQWSGQPLRELRGFGRAERAFFEAMSADEAQRPAWSELAVGEGYSDQSHLCRESRRITGFTPEQLRRRIASDEGFWAYRIWQ
jgi:AraC-like DNA-binding protein